MCFPNFHDEMLADQFFACHRKCKTHLFYHPIKFLAVYEHTKMGKHIFLWYRTNENLQFNGIEQMKTSKMWDGAHTYMHHIF